MDVPVRDDCNGGEASASGAIRYWCVAVAALLVVLPAVLGFFTVPRPLSAPERFIALKIRSHNPLLDAKGLAKLIVAESLRHDIDPFVVVSVIRHESRFQSRAVSSKGAVGLMQLMPSTAAYISRKRGIGWRGDGYLREPYYNITLGIAYLKYLHDVFGGDQERILLAYNWGPTRVKELQRNAGQPVPAAARYAAEVLETRRSWRDEFRLRSL